MEDKDMIICRCEEVTLGEILQAIKDGARDVTGVKRRTRAGMGSCQGSSCERLVEGILRRELKKTQADLKPDPARPPVMPITFGVLGGDQD